MRGRLRFCLLVLLISADASAFTPGESLTLGVFAYRPDTILQERYAPLADYLSEQVGVEFRLEVLNQDAMNRAVAANQVDLFLTNPSHFLQIRSERSLSGVLATLIRRSDNVSTTSLGGVIITRADRSDIESLEDLPGKIIASPGIHFLGGYQAQVLELKDAGIDIRRQNLVRYLDTHDRVVRSVLSGDSDVGFIRTAILEQMEHEIPDLFDQIKVLNRQELSEFPFVVSTRLYPEWPLVALPHVDQRIVRRVASALFAIEPEDPLARIMDIAGFSPPADYQSVEYLARTLRVPPYDQMPQVTWVDVLDQYRLWVVTTLILLILLVASSLWLGKRKRQLAIEQKRLNRLILSWPQPMLMLKSGVLMDANRAAMDLLKHRSVTSMLGRNLASFSPVRQDDGQVSYRKLEQLLAGVEADRVMQSEWLLSRSDGSDIYVDMTLAPIHEKGETDPLVLCSWYDITVRKHAEQRQRLAASVFDCAREAIFITDNHGMVIDVNDAYRAITGRSRSRALGRLPPLPMDEGISVFSSARSQGFWMGEFPSRHPNGDELILSATISSVRDEQGDVTHFVGIFSDISRLKEQERKLRVMAHYDALTALPNRVLFADRLQQAMALTRRQGSRLAVAYIDLDEFKPVNDAYGHRAGDQLLVEVASRMRTELREEDTLARLGGDEFAAIIMDVQDQKTLETLLARLLVKISAPAWVMDHSVEISASIGYTLFAPVQNEQLLEELDGDQLLRQADQAMYQAKQQGRNRYVRFAGEVVQASSAGQSAGGSPLAE
ncbi:PAS domain S-box-containing protein/diguanylate cyclase (GGDEF) domain-containing protein [Marinobacter gudaonensis]|uniref:PAS domain S-box-containing protein/diguanylate cyclase (GGDEF) domain-containing protein n=1 Tax=Marinobacter gudaonensis TaxID=375760 RepID=A0A1I6GZQ9_9GAMM|nr:PhnD/SsuA/transferrin family substrate-binding protein [Marinobacter gudaonensis]SFR47597.1 PAS domain S-box-containing protein/diguanylate cyclase (GGDEF) domain-containing protein [Marinobacter gudaonensis]